MKIRPASSQDFPALWRIIQPTVAAGTTYGFATDLCEQKAEQLWLALPQESYLAEIDGEVVGTYYLKPNNAGPGSHVCNCGYMVAEQARGQGVASALCEHSQTRARALGYLAMQFNFVASSNTGALRLWQKHGFKIVGTLPQAFRHPEQGLIDAHVMYKWLEEAE